MTIHLSFICSSIVNLLSSREQQMRTAKWKGKLTKYLEHTEVSIRKREFRCAFNILLSTKESS